METVDAKSKPNGTARGIGNLYANDESNQILQKAIESHENLWNKKWKQMTLYEKSKVQDTFQRYMREQKDFDKIFENAQKVKHDLGLCLNVKNMRMSKHPAVNKQSPHIKALANTTLPPIRLKRPDSD